MWSWLCELAVARLCHVEEQHPPWTVWTVGRTASAMASFCSGRRQQAPSPLNPFLAWLVLYEDHEALAAWVLWVFYGFSLKRSAWISPLLTWKGMVSVHCWFLSLSFLLGIFIKYRSLRSVRNNEVTNLGIWAEITIWLVLLLLHFPRLQRLVENVILIKFYFGEC